MFTTKGFFLLPLLILTLVLPAHAQNRPGSSQGEISGRVFDKDLNEPIPSATVAIWLASDSTLVTGTITQNDGSFSIKGLKPGSYSTHISYVGYITKIIPGIEIKPGALRAALDDIQLLSDTQLMDEVEVAADREFIEVGIDRTVYNTKDQLVSAGGSATDVLENIPSVEVDIEGNISLRGSQNVAILINGRPSPMTGEALVSYLQGLPSDVLERVEVIPNPSAKYEPDGMAGILNLVLKQNQDLGLSGSVTASATTQTSYNASGN
ncbi:MAG: carboxypeptidase regulatory-like domain-containing protein, partial [Rhodothermales bacterium]